MRRQAVKRFRRHRYRRHHARRTASMSYMTTAAYYRYRRTADASDEVKRIGIERARQEIEQADRVVYGGWHQ
ncbi:hypothetical protein KCP78_19410 [Salmonella enterica subsp. enterica]|nr:hypothetical protein KCP78_19410 [Salmonella enterica subsp. enterica]